MTMLRLVMGSGDSRQADILQLSMRLAAAAKELGLRVEANRASRNSASPSRYVTLRDHGDRPWLIRISNHRMPIDNNRPVPNLDLVSLDGAAGLHEAMMFLHRVAMARAEWHDPADPARRAELKRQRGKRRG